MPKSVRGVMREFKEGALHSGSSTGPTVKKRKQAIAIALSEQRQMGKKRDVESGGAMLGHPARNLGKYHHPKGGY
jgi:hypothetical protein